MNSRRGTAYRAEGSAAPFELRTATVPAITAFLREPLTMKRMPPPTD